MTTHQQPPEPSTLDGYRYRQCGPVELYLGDAAQVLAAMPDDSVDCLVTSPPFWGLRDYGTGHWAGGDPACPHPLGRTRRTDQVTCPACQARWVDPQYGLEASLDDYLDHLVAVFDQARRVLAPAGTCWVNLGDSYSAGTRLAYDTAGGIAGSRHLPAGRRPAPLPPKNLIGVPWRAAFAIQASGWILRNAVVWAKSNHLSPFCLCCSGAPGRGIVAESSASRLPLWHGVALLLRGTPAVRHPQAPRRRRSGSCWESGDGRGWASWCVLCERCRPRRCLVPVELQRS